MTQRSASLPLYLFRKICTDLSIWLLIASNILTIYFTIREGWDILTVMWIYWGQSLVIGFFNFFRLITLKDFSVKNFEVSGKIPTSTEKIKIFAALFFVFHYGFFHFVYMIFLLIDTGKKPVDFNFILVTWGIFFANHLFSFIYNGFRKKADQEKPNLARIIFWPYARIVPMHLTIIFGGFAGGRSLILFLVLKTIADLIMHAVEHAKINLAGLGKEGI